MICWSLPAITVYIYYVKYLIHYMLFYYISRNVFSKSRVLYIYIEQLRWSRGSVLAFSTQVCGFKPGRSRRIFRAKKSSARLPSFGGEVRPSVSCRRFAACKIFRQNYYRTSSSTTVPPFAARISRVGADRSTWRLK